MTEDEHPDGSIITKTSEETSLVDEPIITELTESIEDDEDTVKIKTALKDLSPAGEPEIRETTETEEIKENEIIIRRIIVTRVVQTKYVDQENVIKKLKILTTVTTTDNYPDGSAQTRVETSTMIKDIDPDRVNVIEEMLTGFEPVGEPKKYTTTKTETVTELGVLIKRKITIITLIEEFHNVTINSKRIKKTITTITEDEHPDGSILSKSHRSMTVIDEPLDAAILDKSDIDESISIETALNDLIPEDEPEETETIETMDIKEKDDIIKRTIIVKKVKTKYSDSQGAPRKIKIVTTVTTSDQHSDGSVRTTVDTKTSVTDIDVDGESLENFEKPPTQSEEEIELEQQRLEMLKLENALKDLHPKGEPEITETSEIVDFHDEGILVKRNINTQVVKTRYADKLGFIRKLKSDTKITITDNYPDGTKSVRVDTRTMLYDVEQDAGNVIEESMQGFEPCSLPVDDTTVDTVTIIEDGKQIHRKITTITTMQEFQHITTGNKRTKINVKTITEDEHPDGSIVKQTSERVSLVDESMANLYDEKSKYTEEDQAKMAAALAGLMADEEKEIIENSETQQLYDNDIPITRVIHTKIVKTNYVDSLLVLRKIKTVTTITTIDHYPDGSTHTSVSASTSIANVEVEEMTHMEELKDFPILEDKSENIDTQEKTAVIDGKEVKQVVKTITTNEIFSTIDGSMKKMRTIVTIITQTQLPDGSTELEKDVKVTLSDRHETSFDDSLYGYTVVGDPDKTTTCETDEIIENGVKLIRKTTINTVRQEYENKLIDSRKIKIIVKTTTEDEHPDGTIVMKMSEKVSIADVFQKTHSPPDLVRGETPDCIEDHEIVEDTTEESDIKKETYQQDGITIKRVITTKTKRETLASSDKNIRRVRTTVETTTVDEYPDESTETTKDVKITISEFQKTSDSDFAAALQGLTPTGKVKTSVDKKTNTIIDGDDRIEQIITKYVTKEELKNSETNEIAVKTVTETITENARPDGTVESTKDIKTQITYLPMGTGLDDWTPEELAEIEKQPITRHEEQIPGEIPFTAKEETKVEHKPKKHSSPVGEITTGTETFTRIIKEGDSEVEQTITVVTTKEVISPDKVKTTVATTTVSKGSDGVTKTTKSTKTSISEFKDEFEEIVDTGESEKSFSKLSSRTGDMRSSSAASDDLDHHGISSPPSDISSRAATHVWGTESSGMYYSDDDGQGSPSSTKSQIAHSPRSNLSFEMDTKLTSQRESSQEMLFEKHESFVPHKDMMSTSVYGQLAEDDSYTSSSHSEAKTVIHSHDTKSVGKTTEDFITQEKQQSEQTHHIKTDTTFLQEADKHFEKAIEEHKKVSGSDVISNITAKYEFDSSSSYEKKEESTITLKDIKSESKKVTESSSSSKETKTTKPDTDVKDPIASWGKPLGLPSPIMPPIQSDGKNTPKKQNPSSTVLNKNKLNQEKSKEAKRASESPSKNKAPAPVYMELTYVPHHGNSYYSAVEFFKRVRARYYVFSGTEPSKEIYNALLDAKKTWEDKDLEVTIIPTYDTDVLGYWVTENEEALEKYKIDLSPSASRCTINLQDHETSCAAYRLEF